MALTIIPLKPKSRTISCRTTAVAPGAGFADPYCVLVKTTSS